MEVQVLERRENPLLKRVEVSFKVVHPAEPTPTRDALRAELAKVLKATKDVVIVDGAASTFGRSETHGYAKIYKTKEQALSVERKHVLIRNRLVEPEAKKEGPAAPAKPPKPVPAPKKEEPKPEKKPEAKEEKAPPKAEKAPAKEAPKEEKKAQKPEAKKPEAKKVEPKKAEPKKKEGK